ncbi:cell division control protein 14, SIN component-domain-containing protein [Melanogaster broomeanus]|nr:cell division control protein 14, SIN component-domain-containing protein [Melanogaster broomeanus]
MSMKDTIQDALDDISSPISSRGRRSRALAVLEQQLALACAPNVDDDTMRIFLELQDTFECNVPSRTFTWVQIAASQVESLAGKVSNDHDRETELNAICSQLYQVLSIIQGIVLHHAGSKAFLGRRYPLEILIALLTTSRHTSMITQSSGMASSITGSSSDKSSSVAHLSSAILDTLLCVLVDSSPAIRAFEEANGVQAVVKILKRAGTPREVRMKCLEFLYFYLMDETGPHNTTLISHSTPSSPVTTQPNTPMRIPRPKLIFPRPASGASNSSFASSSSSSSSSSRSTIYSSSQSSTFSLATNSSRTSVHSIRAPSPVKKSFSSPTITPDPHTPPSSPPPVPKVAKKTPQPIKSPAMLMLRKDVDYEPQSPKKVQVSRLGVADRYMTPPPREQALISKSEPNSTFTPILRRIETPEPAESPGKANRHERVRTTDEKKEILGTMLGNVDALVEGVRKAGIWGLS